MTADDLHLEVRQRYAEAARRASQRVVVEPELRDDVGGCCGSVRGSGDTGGCGPGDAADFGGGSPTFGAGLYEVAELVDLPVETVGASLGCGNPTAVADLAVGERVLDLGSGGGIDVLLSARRVGPTGHVIGVDMTPEMLELARRNADAAGATNVEFRRGTIEDLPVADGEVDVVISNCVINLSPDKSAVLTEVYRVLAPGGRIGISDVVAEDHLSPDDRAERGSHVGCVAGALSRSEYMDGLAAAGFGSVSVTFTHEVADGMHGAIIRAGKPAGSEP